MKVPKRVAKKCLELAKVPERQLVNSLSFTFWKLPPSVNNLFATVKGRRVKSREYKAWLEYAALELSFYPVLVPSPVKVEMILTGDINKTRDLDNFWKPILDSATASGVIAGDSLKHVHAVDARYVPSDEEPYLVVAIGRMK